MYEGTIVSVSGRGYFFAEQDHTHSAVFVHQKDVAHRRYLHVGDRIKFNIIPSLARPGQMQAADVEWIGFVVARQISPAVRS